MHLSHIHSLHPVLTAAALTQFPWQQHGPTRAEDGSVTATPQPPHSPPHCLTHLSSVLSVSLIISRIHIFHSSLFSPLRLPHYFTDTYISCFIHHSSSLVSSSFCLYDSSSCQMCLFPHICVFSIAVQLFSLLCGYSSPPRVHVYIPTSYQETKNWKQIY